MTWHTATDAGPDLRDKDDRRALLSMASERYAQNTEWFLKHKNTTLAQLGALVMGEIAVIRIFGTPIDTNISSLLCVVFVLLGLLAFALGVAGIRSCRRSFEASMENILAVNKIVWAMAPSGKIYIQPPVEGSPAHHDDSFFVPRHRKDAFDASDTPSFLQRHTDLRLSKSPGTYVMAVYAIGVLTFVAMIFAALGSIAVVIEA